MTGDSWPRTTTALTTALTLVALFLTPARAAAASSPTVADLGTAMVGWYMALDPAHHHVFVEQPMVNRVRVFTYRGKQVARLRLKRPGQMALSPSGRLLLVVTGYEESSGKGASVTAIDTSTLAVRWRMKGHGRCLSGVAVAAGRVWSTSGCGGVNRLISFDPAHRWRGWARSGVSKLEGPLALARPRHRGHLLAGNRLGCSNCTLTAWHVSGRHATRLSGEARVNGEHEMQFTDNGRRLALAGTVRTYGDGADVVRPRHLDGRFFTYWNKYYPTAVAISPSGNHVVQGTSDRITLYVRGNRMPVRTWRTGYISEGDLVTTPNGRWLFDVVWTVNTWDGCGCHPPHYLLQARHLRVAGW